MNNRKKKLLLDSRSREYAKNNTEKCKYQRDE